MVMGNREIPVAVPLVKLPQKPGGEPYIERRIQQLLRIFKAFAVIFPTDLHTAEIDIIDAGVPSLVPNPHRRALCVWIMRGAGYIQGEGMGPFRCARLGQSDRPKQTPRDLHAFFGDTDMEQAGVVGNA